MRQRIEGNCAVIMHDFTAKHWVTVAVIIVVCVGAFLFSWT